MKRDTPLLLKPTEQPISLDVLREKYLKADEQTVGDLYARVAKALASVEAPDAQAEWDARFLANLNAGAIGAGRIMSAAGAGIEATLINCFVQPVGDCIQGTDAEGYPGIYEALREAAETMRRGGGVGYDFSRIRPKGAEVKGTASLASGPCSYINVFDQSCSTVESAGARRGAQMGVLRIDHPDVLDFITAKRSPGRWNNFNVSVAVTDAFMQALAAGQTWELVHPAKPGQALLAAGACQRDDGKWVYRSLPAAELWDTIMRSAYDFAEPGILFLDHINQDNNLRYCESISATNPCGEQPLPAYGCCDLGPVILTRFVRHPFGVEGEPDFDFAAFEAVVATQVRALDNVLDLTFWPLQQQREEAQAKRRIGVGFTGMGNALCMLKLRYDQADGRDMATRIARSMRDAAYRASVALAQEKGAFPAFEADAYLSIRHVCQPSGRRSAKSDPHPWHPQQPFAVDCAHRHREPGVCRQRVQRHRTTVFVDLSAQKARGRWLHRPLTPWKTMPGACTSSSVAALTACRLGLFRRLAMSAQDHIAMMAAVQPFVDTAISKTVNVPADVRLTTASKTCTCKPGKPGSRAWPLTVPTPSWGRCCRKRLLHPAPVSKAATKFSST
jgi:ribonucleoside-diphosphate reductase alpha chain